MMDQEEEEDVKCNHVFIYGYLGDIIVFCKNCNKDADEIYKGIPFIDQEKLISK